MKTETKPFKNMEYTDKGFIVFDGKAYPPEFVFRALNSHEALLEALKLMKKIHKENRAITMEEFKLVNQAIAQAEKQS